MSVSLLNTALSGLAAFQRSLDTTSNNISNVNTEGYSRQRAELATRPEQFIGGNFVGTGVYVANIARSYDQFITGQVRASNSAFGEVDRFHSLSAQIDNITAADGTSLAPAMKSFFNAVHEVADDPSSIPARQVMLSEAEALTQSFNTLNGRFEEIRDQVNVDMGNMVNDLNSYAKEIADLNVKIVADIGRARGEQLPNELMDQRDALLNKIAKLIDVSVVNQQDGSISVFIGKGQSLVLSDYAAKLSIGNSDYDPTHKEIFMDGQNISNQLSGGSLYGSLRFRDEVLDPSQRQLGLLATSFATEFNRVHTTSSTDLDNKPGVPFFAIDSDVQVLSSASNPGTITASFVEPASALNLGASYRLEVTGSDTFRLTNLSDNSVTDGLTAADLAAPIPAVAASNGFNISFDAVASAALKVGDSFQISPSYTAAKSIKLAITDPKKIAAAGGIVDGLPVVGVPPGDNRNALALAQLENTGLMFNGTATFSDAYGQMVSKVGTQTRNAQVSRSAQDTLLKQATSSWESVSGVNLDEEAANLIKFQQSYQAAAQAISVANSLFDSLIGAVR